MDRRPATSRSAVGAGTDYAAVPLPPDRVLPPPPGFCRSEERSARSSHRRLFHRQRGRSSTRRSRHRHFATPGRPAGPPRSAPRHRGASGLPTVRRTTGLRNFREAGAISKSSGVSTVGLRTDRAGSLRNRRYRDAMFEQPALPFQRAGWADIPSHFQRPRVTAVTAPYREIAECTNRPINRIQNLRNVDAPWRMTVLHHPSEDSAAVPDTWRNAARTPISRPTRPP